MEELIERTKDLNDDKAFQKRLEENNSINIKMFETKKNILLFLVKNKLDSDEDLDKFKGMVDFIVRTGRVRYSYKQKVERLNMVLNKIL